MTVSSIATVAVLLVTVACGEPPAPAALEVPEPAWWWKTGAPRQVVPRTYLPCTEVPEDGPPDELVCASLAGFVFPRLADTPCASFPLLETTDLWRVVNRALRKRLRVEPAPGVRFRYMNVFETELARADLCFRRRVQTDPTPGIPPSAFLFEPREPFAIELRRARYDYHDVRTGQSREGQYGPPRPPSPPPPDPAPVEGPARCTTVATAFGCAHDELRLGLAEERREAHRTFYEGGVLLSFDGDVVREVRLQPCPPLRGDLAPLRALGFEVDERSEVVSHPHADALEGDNDFYLEGRPAECAITRPSSPE